MLNYDSHLHKIENWPYDLKGGIILAVDDNERPVPGAISNAKLEALNLPLGFLKAFHASGNNVYLPKNANALYFHPCRNSIDFDFIKKKIIFHNPEYVVIDTFYGVSNLAIDLNSLVRQFSSIKFLLAHGGGYELMSIVQITRYNSNCFIDFSATLGIFTQSNLVNIRQWMLHCSIEPRIRQKVLFGSDYPEFCVDQHAALYGQFFEDELLIQNFWGRFLNHF
jgi:predicted TIM-barrel fold metal-dependent hydrolase